MGAPEDRRPAFHGRRLWGGHPALFHTRLPSPRQEGPREGGSSSAERLARSRSAGRKAAGATIAEPTEERRVGEPDGRGWFADPELLCRGKTARRPCPSNGWAAGELGGRAGGPEAGFSRPQASARPPGLFKDGRRPRRGLTSRGWSGSRTVLVSGRPGWWSRALCRSRARGKSKWGGRPGNGWARRRTGGRPFTAAGFGAATRPFRKTLPSPPADGACAGGRVAPPSPPGCLARGVAAIASTVR